MTKFGTIKMIIETEVDLDELSDNIGGDYSREDLRQLAFEDFCEELETATDIYTYIRIED